jgi:hypothetical protein
MDVGVAVVGILVLLAFVFGLGWLVVKLATATKQEARAARVWQVETRSTRLGTAVEVVRGSGREGDRVMIATIPPGARDWQELYLSARAEAESRAALLNSGV